MQHKGHAPWRAEIRNRTARGQQCPECTKLTKRERKQAGIKDQHVADMPDLADQWDRTLNGTHSPVDVKTVSKLKVWWRCPKSECQHPHVWPATVYARCKLGTGCPFCSGRQICECKSLAALRPELAAEWDQEGNGDVRPEQVPLQSNKKVWWKHLTNGGQVHKWQACIHARTSLQGTGCPHCQTDRYRCFCGTAF